MTTQPRLLGGRYELGELIGYGGMAEVHRGRDVRLGRDVAIKVLRADLARDPSFLNRFRREAQAAAGLNHPSIVSVYDTGEDVIADGTTQPYIVMEYVEGRTLRDILKAEGRLPARRAMEVTADVCGALDFSHRNGIVHRDIKPANVMITQAGAVKVMDFGIARALADNAATVTQTANVIGTAQYLSPEQARGETVDARSDVYSTGCLLYELVTGAPPFQGDSPVAVAYQHVRENAVAPSARNPELPRAIDSIVMKALAKNQLNRYQSAGEMRTDLQRALANQPVAAESVMTDAERTQFIARTPPPPVALPHREADLPLNPDHERRNALIWVAIVVALLLVIGGVVAFVLLSKNSNDTKPTATVPSVIGKTVTEAQKDFTGVGLLSPDPAGKTTNGPCDDGSKPTTDNVVCKLLQGTRTVLSGDKIDKGSTVYYEVYVQAKVNVPYVTGISYTDAVNQLQPLGLHARERKVNSAEDAGIVTHQSPDVNATLPPGGTVVLDVSTGKVKLKDVRGEKADQAQADLNTLQFTNFAGNQTRVTHDQSKDGTVAAESPTPGIAYPLNTKITLTVYQYRALPPTCTTPPPSPASSSGGPTTSPTGSPTVTASPTGLPPCR